MAINSNIDFIVNSIDFRYNIDNKAFIQSLEINIFIDVYPQLITLILFSIQQLIATLIKVQEKYFIGA